MSLFDDMNASLAECEDLGSEEVTHTPAAGYPYSINVLREDPALLGESRPGVVMTLFASDSGFDQIPVKGDTFTVGSDDYRVFEVKLDEGHGVFVQLAKKAA